MAKVIEGVTRVVIVGDKGVVYSSGVREVPFVVQLQDGEKTLKIFQ